MKSSTPATKSTSTPTPNNPKIVHPSELVGRIGVIADVQFAPRDDAYNFRKTRIRRYHNALNILYSSVKFFNDVQHENMVVDHVNYGKIYSTESTEQASPSTSHLGLCIRQSDGVTPTPIPASATLDSDPTVKQSSQDQHSHINTTYYHVYPHPLDCVLQLGDMIDQKASVSTGKLVYGDSQSNRQSSKSSLDAQVHMQQFSQDDKQSTLHSSTVAISSPSQHDGGDASKSQSSQDHPPSSSSLSSPNTSQSDGKHVPIREYLIPTSPQPAPNEDLVDIVYYQLLTLHLFSIVQYSQWYYHQLRHVQQDTPDSTIRAPDAQEHPPQVPQWVDPTLPSTSADDPSLSCRHASDDERLAGPRFTSDMAIHSRSYAEYLSDLAHGELYNNIQFFLKSLFPTHPNNLARYAQEHDKSHQTQASSSPSSSMEPPVLENWKQYHDNIPWILEPPSKVSAFAFVSVFQAMQHSQISRWHHQVGNHELYNISRALLPFILTVDGNLERSLVYRAIQDCYNSHSKTLSSSSSSAISSEDSNTFGGLPFSLHDLKQHIATLETTIKQFCHQHHSILPFEELVDSHKDHYDFYNKLVLDLSSNNGLPPPAENTASDGTRSHSLVSPSSSSSPLSPSYQTAALPSAYKSTRTVNSTAHLSSSSSTSSSLPSTTSSFSDPFNYSHSYIQDLCPGYKLAVLDSYRHAVHGFPISHPNFHSALEFIKKDNPNITQPYVSPCDWAKGLQMGSRHYVPYNGMISPEQLQWLETQIQQLDHHVRLLVVTHVAASPYHTSGSTALYDGDQLIQLFRRYPGKVAIMFSGHDHSGHYVYDNDAKTHFVTIAAPIEADVCDEEMREKTVLNHQCSQTPQTAPTPRLDDPPIHACALVELYKDECQIVGLGSAVSRYLRFE